MCKVDCVVYSKNRACQLNLLLRSIKDKFENVGSVYVLYTTSSELHEISYREAFKIDYGLDLIKVPESNFKKDHENVLNSIETEFFLPLCEDDCFIENTNVDDIISEYKCLPDVSAISLKGGLNIKKNYPNIEVKMPSFLPISQNYLVWNWSDSRPDIDWGYPTCINAFLYEKEYYLGLIREARYTKTPEIEPYFNTIRNKFKPMLMSFKETKIVNFPVNRIQTTTPTNPNGITHYFEPEYLAKLFNAGFFISTDKIYGMKVDSGNVEVKFEFDKL